MLLYTIAILSSDGDSFLTRLQKLEYGVIMFASSLQELSRGIGLRSWVHKGCKPQKDEFGIVGIQIAGQKLHLYVLIRDEDEIDNYVRLISRYNSQIEIMYIIL